MDLTEGRLDFCHLCVETGCQMGWPLLGRISKLEEDARWVCCRDIAVGPVVGQAADIAGAGFAVGLSVGLIVGSFRGHGRGACR